MGKVSAEVRKRPDPGDYRPRSKLSYPCRAVFLAAAKSHVPPNSERQLPALDRVGRHLADEERVRVHHSRFEALDGISEKLRAAQPVFTPGIRMARCQARVARPDGDLHTMALHPFNLVADVALGDWQRVENRVHHAQWIRHYPTSLAFTGTLSGSCRPGWTAPTL